MRILFLIDKMKNFAGIERILTCKMNYISEHTVHKVYLITYEQQSTALPFRLNKSIIHKDINVSMPLRGNSTFTHWLLSYINIRRLFKNQFKILLTEIKPEIVICTSYSFQVMDIIIETCFNLGIKTIIESHTKGETTTLSHKFKYNSYLYALTTLLDYYIMRKLKHNQCVVTLTKQDVPFWEKYAKRIETIPNMLTIAPQKVIDYNSKRVISAGRYMTEKGFDRLLKIWRIVNIRYKDWHLYIFGDGDRSPYQSIVEQYQLTKTVHLMPPTSNIAGEFEKSSVFVMTSRYEGFGLVLAEAMSCGLPCISFDCPYGPRNIIKDGEDGILAEDGNIEDFAKKLELLLSNIELRKTLGMNAVKNIARLSPDSIMTKWITLFQTI